MRRIYEGCKFGGNASLNTYMLLVSQQRDVGYRIGARERSWRVTICPVRGKKLNTEWKKKTTKTRRRSYSTAVHTCSNSAQVWKRWPWACRSSRSSRTKKQRHRGAAARRTAPWSPAEVSDVPAKSPRRQHPGVSSGRAQRWLMFLQNPPRSGGFPAPLNLTSREKLKRHRNIKTNWLQRTKWKEPNSSDVSQ